MYGRIVVGVAKTESAKRALEVAADLAQRYDADLHLVMAFDRARSAPGRDARDDAETHLSLLSTTCTVPVQTHAIPGDPADTLLMVADEVKADLVVVGNKGMQGARRILGSVPNSVAHGASASVLIVDTTGGQ
jgi:nucleotide-binding universal stress UspA family protein